MKEKFETPRAPIPASSVAQVSIARKIGIAEITGLCVIDEKKRNYARPVKEQTEGILYYLEQILSELGLTRENIIKSNVFLRDMKDYPEMNEAYTAYFGTENPPARQTVAVGLADGYDVEISFVAVL